LCILFCLKEGLLVNNIAINKVFILQWLEKLTKYDWFNASIYALLNPKDLQNVACVICLLTCIAKM
ncbi:hypothetical protein CPB85DRAFT_1243083, partial [Mucidula mucida]